MSRHWVFSASVENRSYGPVVSELFTFPEWARDRAFYERLLDGDQAAVDVFSQYKSLMDAEVEEAGF